MIRIRPSEHRRMPWRNGGGTTSEILVDPAPDGEGAFRARLSIADVATDGPFSHFAGCDRHIVLLDGRGMTLDCGEHGRIDLVRRQPRSFSGDWTVVGALVDGPVRDLNWIVDRRYATSSLEVRTLVSPLDLSVVHPARCLVHVLEGQLQAAETHDTLVLDASAAVVPIGTVVVAIAWLTPTRR